MARLDLGGSRLYGILDLGYVRNEGALQIAMQMLDGGVDVLQLRAKGRAPAEISELARQLHQQTLARGVPLIINDHPQIAAEVGAEGVHVGQDDLRVFDTRAIAGPDCLVGKSTHSVAQAIAAAREGADYIGFGPLFATPTKPDYPPIGLDQIAEVHRVVSVPVFYIGGIKLENLQQVVNAGARRVVIVSGLLHANDTADYARAARRLLPP